MFYGNTLNEYQNNTDLKIHNTDLKKSTPKIKKSPPFSGNVLVPSARDRDSDARRKWFICGEASGTFLGARDLNARGANLSSRGDGQGATGTAWIVHNVLLKLQACRDGAFGWWRQLACIWHWWLQSVEVMSRGTRKIVTIANYCHFLPRIIYINAENKTT